MSSISTSSESMEQQVQVAASNPEISTVDPSSAYAKKPSKTSKVQSDVYGLFQTGAYKNAFEKMELYLSSNISPSDRRWLKNQALAIASSYGFSLIKTGNCPKASEIFLRGLE